MKSLTWQDAYERACKHLLAACQKAQGREEVSKVSVEIPVKGIDDPGLPTARIEEKILATK